MKGPVIIDLDDTAPAAPEAAPPVPDDTGPPPAMARAAALAGRPPSGLARAFWGVLGALATMILSLAAWDWIARLFARSQLLGGVALVLTAVLLAILLAVALREAAAFARLARLDGLQRQAQAALTAADARAARAVAERIGALYAHRPELTDGLHRLRDRSADQFDADAILQLAEAEVLAPLDTAARAEIEAAARQVATVTAVVPLALADVAVALTANLRMIRRIAEVYGGRAGTLGAWRLTRTVMAHLVATGALAVGDDLIGSVAGGSVLTKLSRRFGEGVVNGALTARVGVAAMEVCRPLPFSAGRRPSVAAILGRAVRGLFGNEG